MKKFKKIIAIVMTIAMVSALGVGLTASAAGDGSIAITPPSSLSLNGLDVFAYQIFDLETASGGGYLYKEKAAYTGFFAYFLAKETTITTLATTLMDYIYEIKGEPGEQAALKVLAKHLYDWSLNDGGTPRVTPITETGTSGGVTFDNLDYGYYLIFAVAETTDGKDVEVTALCMLATVEDDTPVAVALKADAPSINKEVWNHGTTGASDPDVRTDPGWDEWTDVNIGDTVNFRYMSKVPTMTGYDRYWFIVHDSLSEGLTLVPASIEVYLGTSPTPLVQGSTNAYADISSASGADYIVTASAYDGYTAYTGGNNFSIIFNPFKFVGYTPGADIYITYEAVLNDDAKIGYEGATQWGNPNKVYLEYSSNPYDTGTGATHGKTGETPEEEVWVYTFEIDIYKYTNTPTTMALEGAEFELRTITGDSGSAIVFVEEDPGDSTDPAVYRVALDSEKATGSTTIVSPESGNINIIGLDAGTYYLVETLAPEGYSIVDAEITVVITHTKATSLVEVTWGDSGTGIGTINIENKTGTIFPGTGGIGRTIFIVVGLTLMVGAVVVLTVRRKVSKAVR